MKKEKEKAKKKKNGGIQKRFQYQTTLPMDESETSFRRTV